MQRLKPIAPCGKTKDGHIKWMFVCECGTTKEIAISRVKHGYTRSCGCLAKETKPGLTHGYKGTTTYSSWAAAKDRTTNPRSKDFYRYGGVGIGMHPRWLSFENFLADMGERPAGTSLDRIDGSKGYEPGNCRWATFKEQARNRKDNIYVETSVGTMLLVDYAKRIGITKGAAHLRLKRGKLEGAVRV